MNGATGGAEARLDRIIALLELVFSEQLDKARAEVRADPIAAAILDRTEDWTGSGTVKSEVASSTGSSEKTVQRRIAELVEKRLLEVDGSSASRRVKSTGLV